MRRPSECRPPRSRCSRQTSCGGSSGSGVRRCSCRIRTVRMVLMAYRFTHVRLQCSHQLVLIHILVYRRGISTVSLCILQHIEILMWWYVHPRATCVCKMIMIDFSNRGIICCWKNSLVMQVAKSSVHSA
ncbi:uncharacterized protein LOC106865750 [Brachypodium distachyon]|uniref:uncharacterized protein LOC106865750 n=1 Tax=Brachypodium distachyon TaxID=15368 RepID=UPI000D0DDB3C|nr:uncharacterized protein LOC106865750 [Brachypodium distachyon]|eukprot:XP_024316451.1 uncharacterized protein LOC106865750 [Brachypodium distachyon]